MNKELKPIDYVVSAFGIIGALHVIGFFGQVMSVLRILILLISLGIIANVIPSLILKWFAGELTDGERRVSLLYVVTNSLPALAVWMRHHSH